jgi:molybdopterin-biosynthesis enzyme MoeA-like protein
VAIGSKILSGRTKDQNVGYIAEYLTALGIDLREVRVIGDEERAIVDAINALRATPMSSPPAGSSRPTVTLPPTAWRRHSVC